jgi:protein-tyrosine-phosphatase/predicted ATP-grasp superfamily ATP-dependent carboligase
MAKSALILRCDDRSGLTVIRSLGRAGIKVDVGWPVKRCAIRSRYVRHVFDLPDPSDQTGSWLETLKSLVTRYNYDLIIPCDDRAIIPIQQHKNEINKYARVYALTEEAFLATFDKYQTMLLAERCSIRLPRWALVRSPEEIASVSEQFSFPVVLKPLSSFSIQNAEERREVRSIRDRNDFSPTLKMMLRGGAVLVQTYFSGRGVGIELAAKDGAVLAAFQHERVHEPPSGGASSYRRSVPLDTELLAAAAALVAQLHYTGVIMVEFRVNDKIGDWTLIETNGRFWGSLPLAVASGMDFPRYLYEMLVEGRTNFSKSYKTGVYCRNLTLDLSWFKKNLKADRSDPTLQVVPLTRVFTEFWNVLTLAEHIDTFALDDPLPFFIEIRELAARGSKFLLQRASRGSGLSTFLKRRRVRRARSKISRAGNVIFVCYGNICRSPFAEAYARSIAPSDITFMSAGTFSKADRRSPQEAQAAAGRFGIDLDKHRSQVLSAAMIDRSDVIFVFDRRNLEEISLQFPRAKSRIVRLGDFLPGPDDEIHDPFGQSLERFEYCYRTIVDLLSQIARHCWTTGNQTTEDAFPVRHGKTL